MTSFTMFSINKLPVSSRLSIWMTPVADNNRPTDLLLGDFKIWEDDSSSLLMQQDVPLLLTPLEYNPADRYQYQQISQPKNNQCAPRRERFRMPNNRKYPEDTRAYRESSCNSSGGSTSCSNSDISEAIMNMKIGVWKPLPKQSCGFCYIQYKRHCQKLGIAYPRPTDAGFWAGHVCKDENGDVICPELRKLTCPLCFATDTKAHTLKFCPLNTGKNIV